MDGIQGAADNSGSQAVASPSPIATPEGDPRANLTNPIYAMLGGGAGNEPEPSSTPTPALNEPQPAAEPAPGVPGTTGEELIMGKFKSTEDIVKSYQELQQKLGEQGNQLGEIPQLKQQLQQLQAQLSQQPQSGQGQEPEPGTPTTPEMSPEKIAELNEKFMEKFYENPIQMIAELAEKVADTKYKPIAERDAYRSKQEQYLTRIDKMAETNPDMNELLPEMDRIARENPFLNDLPVDKALETAYKMAKSTQAEGLKAQLEQANAQVKPFEELMRDPENLKKVLSDETVRNEILRTYATQIKEGKPPQLIGSQPAGVPPAAPMNQITNTTEAKKASLGFFNNLPFFGR